MYIPKNKISTNLVAKQDEYIDSSGAYYNGFYYKIYTGQTFMGKFPGDGINREIFLAPPKTTEDAPPPSPIQSLTTSTTPPLYPTEQDYKNGMFDRYFSKKRNEYLFEELTKSQYDALNNPKNLMFTLYQPFSIKWMLTGEKQKVADFNFYSIRNAEEKEGVLGLNEFLKMNYLQYYK